MASYTKVQSSASVTSVEHDRDSQPARSLTDQAYDRIVNLIEHRLLDHGDVLSHRRLAERLGISTQPVRGAVDRLEREGVLESVPRVGTRLRRITAEDFWGHLQWRVALEMHIARLACDVISAEDRRRLADAADATDAACEKKALDSAQVDTHFHLQLAEACGADHLRRELQRLDIYHLKLSVCEVVEAMASMVQPPSPPPNHRTLAQSIIEATPEEAADCMRRHIEYSTSLYGFMRWYRQHNFSPKT